ncbi:MAG: DUF1285 domain-containing protein [Sphingomonadales bacterium]|nr:DUF1285 domain-containing protein [Sphingomonadales bacterium]
MNDKTTPSPELGGMADVMRAMAEKSYPPVHLWNPDFCGDMDIRIAKDGTWYYLGSPIGRKELVRLFASILKREGDEHFLVTPVEKVRIKVDVAPLHAVEMFVDGEGAEQVVTMRTLTDDHIRVDKDHPIRVDEDPQTGEPTPFVHVRDGLEALINRNVFYQLVEMAEDRDGELGVMSCGTYFPLGRVE